MRTRGMNEFIESIDVILYPLLVIIICCLDNLHEVNQSSANSSLLLLSNPPSVLSSPWGVVRGGALPLLQIMNQDLVRVFRGFGLVIDQIVTLNKPGFQSKLNRAQYHASELVKAVLEMRNDLNTVSQQIQTSSAGSRVVENNGFGNRSAPLKQESEHDLIGFSKIEKDRSARDHNRHQNNTKHSDLEYLKKKQSMRERPVPSTQIERLWGFGSLAARMTAGVIADSATRIITGDDRSSGISDANAERLAEALCRMRGAALKLGQMLSMQDDAVLPGPLSKALDRVKQAADYMPRKQLEQQLENQLGADWQKKFQDFDYVPIAAASIGQVHKAKLLDGTVVAMKIQYPGVADSIDSDLNNLKRLVTVTNALPPGLFIDQIIKVARTELSWECTQTSSRFLASHQQRFHDFFSSNVSLTTTPLHILYTY
jgi:ABC1 atypical kinase-like domain